MNPKKQLEEARAKLAALKAELTELGKKEEITDEEQARFDEALTEWDTVSADEKQLADKVRRFEAVEAAEVREQNVERTFPTVNVQKPAEKDDIYRVDPARFVGMTESRVEREMVGHAERAVDSWDGDWISDENREAAMLAIKRGQKRSDRVAIAAQIARTSNPEYVEAWEKYISNPATAPLRMNEQERAALAEGTNSNGGFLVPPMLDPTIILTNNGTTNPIRGIATVKTIATQTWKGVTSAGVTAEWAAEAAEAADASPTFAQPSITPVRADAWIQASFEMLEDTGIAGDIAELLADARDRLESTAFAVGTGSTQPKGIVTAVSAVTASRVAGSSGAAGAADFVVADVYALANALPPRHRPNSSWLSEQTTYNKIRQFATGSGPQHAFWADLGVAIPPLLLGRPTYESSEMDNTIVSGSNDDVLLIGDFRKFYIVDRVGMSVMFEPLVKGSNRRPTGEVGWLAFWRVGSDAVDTGAFRLLRL